MPALSEQAAFIHAIVDHALEAIVVTDMHGRIVEFNHAAEALFGYAKAAVLGQNVGSLIVPMALRADHEKGLARIARRGDLADRPIQRRLKSTGLHASGQTIAVEVGLTSSLLNGAVHIMAFIRDITAKEQFSQALLETLDAAESTHRKKEMELDRVRESEENATRSWQTQQLVTELLRLSLENKSLAEELRRAVDLIVALPWLSQEIAGCTLFWRELDSEAPMVALRADLPASPLSFACERSPAGYCLCRHGKKGEGGAVVGHDTRFCLPITVQGRECGVLELVLVHEAQHLPGFDVAMDNIGQSLATLVERGHIYQALKQSRDKAESANRAKSEFLANMSHEIRSPLNAIIGMTDLILNTDQSREEQHGNLKIVHAASLALLDIINSVLDLSKIEAGHLVLESIPFDLLGQVETCCDTAAVRAHQKGLNLYCHVVETLPPTLVGDPSRLGQILTNLLSNAVKFTDQGEVVVRAEPWPPVVEGTMMVHFSVSDTGVGIPADKQAIIFENFTQADGSTSRKYGGTGLGLTISQHLVQRMGGHIWVESAVGQGSTFHFLAQFGIGALRQGKEVTTGVVGRRSGGGSLAPLLKGRRLLVADRHDTGRKIVGQIVAGLGAEVIEVADGTALLEALDQAVAQGMPFDTMVVDEDLVHLNWSQPAAHQHHAGCLGKAIVLLSSHVVFKDVARPGFLQEAVPLKKPVKRFQLLKKINQIVGVGPIEIAVKPAHVSGLRPDAVPLHILVVDDVVENQQLAAAILKHAGHHTTVAGGGEQALVLLRQTQFDLVLMDLQMPEMDGFEAVRRIRQGGTDGILNPQVPVIALTAATMMDEPQRCLTLGMNQFLSKPYVPHQLLNVIAPYTKPLAKVSQSKAKSIVLKPVDIETGALIALKSRFVTESASQMEELTRGLAQRDAAWVVRAGVGLKKMAAAIGAARIETQAVRLVGHAEMADWDEAQAIAAGLEQYVDEMIHFLVEEERANEDIDCRR
ncbi:MAG: response regulator [Magnetococcales bacterium]|nr:response regulator [Magnetococcales bacterium]